MADKRIEFDLVFKSNVDQAKKQMKDLQKTLNSIATGNKLDLSKGMTQEIKEATKAASELQTHLLKATNVNTGRLNMNEFDRSIKASGGSLKQYAAQLAQLGPTGRTALMQVSQAIANAEKPTLRLSGAIDKMWVAMKNTMRWQLSTTALNAVTGAINEAYQYAQKLNRSLNDIRIVTDRSVDEMAEFAKQANRAAQALSATTTEYTKASLIYYQQGLSDEEVAKRTETTIKLANVTRTSAETVSEWMTSIWNNFDNGSKSLEYYADVITALGAATASSSEEIATGLEKFSAVAESVGLSYEYATSALATITATTRQSADVVGTALKTLFARMQDLELGKTLDDGTTMGQYSDNLAKIGVNVLDVSGQLREMDAVLDDLGARWDNLTEAQKVATAQGVAGIRQYTQFMALMENWDFMQQNLATASGASGALDTQADIYAESWEAAQKRVTASAEKLYDSLLNDEVFIKMTNVFADFLNVLDPILKGLGGIPGVLGLVLAAIVKIKGQDIAGGLTRMGNALYDVTDKGQQAAERLRKSRLQIIKNAIYDVSDPTHPDNGAPEEADANNRRLKMIEIAQNYGANWDAETQSQFQDAVKLQEVLEEQLNTQRKKVVAAQEEVKEQEKLIDEIKELNKLRDEDKKILDKGEPVPKKNRTLTKKQQKQKEAYDVAAGRENRRKELGEEPLKQAEQQLKEKQELLDQETQMENKRLEQNEQFITEQEENFNRQANSTKNWATAVTTAIGAVSMAMATISTISTLFQTLSSPDTTDWEKFAAFVPVALGGVIGAFKLYSAVKNEDTAITTLNSAAQTINALTMRKSAEAATTLSGAITSVWVALWPVLLVMIAVAAVIGTIVAIISAIKKHQEEYTKAVQKANAAADRQRELLSEVRSEYDNLKSSLDSLTESQKSIDTMIEGTDEWRQAVQEVNMQVMELISKYPELAQYVSTVNGRMSISEAGQEALLAAQYAEITAQSGRVSLAQMRANTAAMELGADQIAQNAISGVNMSLEDALRGRIIDIQNGSSNAEDVSAQIKEQREKYDIQDNLYNSLISDSRFGNTDTGTVTIDKTSLETALQGISKATFNLPSVASKAAQETEKLQGIVDSMAALGEDTITITQSSLNVEKALVTALETEESAIGQLVESNQKLVEANNKLEQAYIRSLLGDEYTEAEKQIISEVVDTRVTEEGKKDARDKAETYRVNDAAYNKEAAERWLIETYGEERAATLSIKHFDGKNFSIWDSEKDDYLTGSGGKQGQSYNEIFKDLAEIDYIKGQTSAAEGTTAEDYRAAESTLKNANLNITETARAEIANAIAFNKNKADNAKNKVADLSALSRDQLEELEQYKDGLNATSQEYIIINAAIDNYETAVANAGAQDREAYNGLVAIREELTRTQEALGLSTDEWIAYEKAVKNALNLKDAEDAFTSGLTRVIAGGTAAIKGLNKVWNEYQDIMSNPNPLSEDYIKATAEINKQLETWLGVDNLELDPDFIAQHFDTIAEIARGELSNVPTLMDAISGELVSSNTRWDKDLQQNWQNFLEGIKKDEYQIGQYLNQADADALANMYANADETTAKEIEAMLAAKGFSIEEAMTNGVLDFSKIQFRGWGTEYIDPNILGEITEELLEQIDRYHEIKEILSDISNELNEINTLSEQAFGSSKLIYLDQQAEALERQTTALQRYNKEVGVNLNIDKQALLDSGYGFEFDAAGRVSNYTEVLTQLANNRNSEGVENAKELISQYEETLNLSEDVSQQILDNHYAILDAKLEKVTTQVEIDMEFNEQDIEYLDFLIELLDKDAKAAADSIELIGKKAAETADNIEVSMRGFQELEALVYDGKGTAESIEKMKEYYNNILSGINTLRDLGDQIAQAVQAEFDAWNEDLAEKVEHMEHLTSILEGYQNIVDLLGQDFMGISDETMKAMLGAQQTAATNALAATKRTLEANRKSLADAETELQTAQARLLANPNDQAAKDVATYWEEIVEKIRAEVEAGEGDLMDKWATALQAAADIFKFEVQQVADTFSEAVGGIYGSIQEMQEMFKQNKELGELYLKDYKKIYEINKLNRQITDSIDTTTNLKAQQMLRDLQSELLEFQESGVEMSKYDLEYKQKEYDLLVAQIALEEAQNAKNQVRLTRDASGNWGYVYTANAAETEKAEQNYEDKTYAMQDFMSKSEEELSQFYLQSLSEYYDTVQKLADTYGEGSDKYLEGVEQAQIVLQEKTGYALGELSNLVDAGLALGQKFGIEATKIYSDTIIGQMYPQYKTFSQLAGGVNKALVESTSGLQQAYINLQTTVNTVCEEAGVDIKDFEKVASGMAEDVKIKTDDLLKSVNSIASAYESAFSGAVDAADRHLDDYKHYMKQYIGLAQGLKKSWSDAAAAQTAYDKQQAFNRSTQTAAEEYVNDYFSNDYGISDQLYNQGYNYAKTQIANNSSAQTKGLVKDGQLTDAGEKIAKSFASSYVSRAKSNAVQAVQDSFMSSGSTDWQGNTGVNASASSAISSALDTSNSFATEKFNETGFGSTTDASGNSVSILENAINDYQAPTEKENNNTNDEGSLSYTITDIRESGKVTDWRVFNGTDIVKKWATATDSNNNTMYIALDNIPYNKNNNTITIQREHAKIQSTIFYNNPSQELPITEYKSIAGHGWKNYYPAVKVGGMWFYNGHGADYFSPVGAKPSTIPVGTLLKAGGRTESKDIEDVVDMFHSAQGTPVQPGKPYTLDAGDPNSLDNFDIKDNSHTPSTIGDYGTNRISLDKGEDVTIDRIVRSGTTWYVRAYGGGMNGTRWFRYGEETDGGSANHMIYFDTGGYTGEWGSSGKMAMLHEKEIVLNKYDTANLLSAIDLVRQFESSLSSMQWGLGALRAVSTNSLSNNLEQTVTIHAEFPNATDHNEIEQAFDNLVNLASQYAQKK